ncbi:MAG: hypothetical protein ABI165_10595, partial [Bryobacteraceae bacterium]
MTASPVMLSVWITAVAVVSVVLGICLTGIERISRRIIPFGAGVLIGVAVLFVLPELADFFQWRIALAWFAGGFALLWVIDRRIYAVCPSCSPGHDHDHCGARLHGFAGPLLAAAALHSFLDGWAVGSGSQTGSSTLGVALVVAIALHKLPEGIALGV